MADGFPLVTTRKVPYKAIIKEMLWFISGSTDNRVLNEQGVKIWDKWAVRQEDIDKFCEKHKEVFGENVEYARAGLKEEMLGNIGPLYSMAWRAAPVTRINPLLKVTEDMFASDKIKHVKQAFDEMMAGKQTSDEERAEVWQEFITHTYQAHVDQLHNLVTSLKKDPYGSRHVMSAWIPEWLPIPGLYPQENVLMLRGALAPCHVLVQCHVVPPNDGEKPKLILQMYQRSVDTPVGAVFNIAQYAVLLHLLAKVCGYEPYEFIYNTGDVHVYSDQVDLVKEQLKRSPRKLPKLVLDDSITDLFQVTADQIDVIEYDPDETIAYPVAV